MDSNITLRYVRIDIRPLHGVEISLFPPLFLGMEKDLYLFS
jgi:hypothetical protein